LSTSIKRVLSKDLKGAKIILVIGPEGGFTDAEEKILIENGYISTSFGNRVLRTETASLYALSIINYILMR
jgi:16S rRNA (uracil1498-N3)-methyltransferase